MTFLTALTHERAIAARLTQRGIGMPLAGGLYWLAVAWLQQTFEARSAMLYGFALTGAVFPVGALATRLAGGNLFAHRPGVTTT